MPWSNYSYKKPEYPDRKPGDYRCVILSAEVGTSKTSGKKMLTISFRPSGTTATVRAYIVDNDYFDDNFSRFLDAFPALKNNPDPENCFAWRGAQGAAWLKVNDSGFFEFNRWIPEEKTSKMADFIWKARDNEPQEMPVLQEFTDLSEEDDDGEIPF